jgi:uncharacterized small protein (DUF1192 family)
MAIAPDDLEPRRPQTVFLPPDLSRHSIAELETLIVTLEGEITRCKDAIASKRGVRAAAESFFKK